MYFGALHIFSIFACIVVFAFVVFLFFYFLKDKKLVYLFSFCSFGIFVILCYSILLSIDAAFKKVVLKNEENYLSSSDVMYIAYVHNIGRYPVKSCTLTLRIINKKNQKIDGSIFDTSKSFTSNRHLKARNSYVYEYNYNILINPNSQSIIRAKIPYPKHFNSYKLNAKIFCK